MSTVILDTITGKSTATNITIGSTPVVSASANSMTIRGEGSNQTSIQQGLGKTWVNFDSSTAARDSFNISSLDDDGTGDYGVNFSTSFANNDYAVTSAGANGSASVTSYSLNTSSFATGAVEVEVFAISGSGASKQDRSFNCLVIHGDLA